MSSGNREHAPPSRTSSPAGTRDRRPGVERWWDEAVLARVRIIRAIPSTGPALASALLLVNVVLGVLPVAFVVATSVVIGQVPAAVAAGVGSQAWSALVRAFLAAAALFALQTLLTPVQHMLGELMTRRMDGLLQQRLIRASLRSTGIGPLEDPAVLDSLDEVNRWFEARAHTPGGACAGMLALVARYVRLAALTALLGAVASWAMAVALLVAVLVFRTGQRGGLRVLSRVYDTGVGAVLRRANHLRGVAMGSRDAKELRLFGLTAWFTDRYVDEHTRAHDRVSRARRRVFLVPYLGYTALGLLAVCSVLALLASDAAQGAVSLTGLALALQATAAMVMCGANYPEADLQTSLGMRAWQSLDTLEERMSRAEGQAAPPEAAGAVEEPVTGPAPVSVELRSVRFSYPNAGGPVLDGLDLSLAPGRCTAVVGVNGAGKTTLVKLLTRLHEPDAGDIVVDGRDVRRTPVEIWRRQVSVVFQDFVRYEFSAADNIACGAVHLPVDREGVRDAARRAGVLDTLEALPHGIDTVLSRKHEGGAELSGGQWQRVAIARSLYALDAGARLLVLDEPTSALDVRAEAAFFDSFIELTAGVTSVLISHRFSSVRRADGIVVVEGGRVVEQGTHEELMALGNRYAHMFRLQAERFDPAGRGEGRSVAR
ncbi:ABC transporter ATP-binding protein [Nocardiopsis sp. NPDC006198]|uniref:ABC transporter ATP-binding protein n=1 Tax=Nocardiopsis sp. NPDC006198 TaxID=3154472 RepID=UPI0033A01F3C